MAAFTMSYRLLFLLQNPTITIFEIERLDLPATAPKNERYYWLHYVAATTTLTRLDFVAMHSAPPLEERQFEQGKLAFSAKEGIFWPIATPAIAEALTIMASHTLPPPLAAQVMDLFANH
jgi:hypothetical protein